MKEVFLSNRRDALVPVTDEGFDVLGQYPKDAVLRVKITQTRSLPHHRFFHAFIGEAFSEWPEGHKIQPSDTEYLRAWCLVKANIKEIVTVNLGELGIRNPMAAIASLKLISRSLTSKPVWFNIDTHLGIVEMQWAKSIAFDKMDEAEFRETTARVFDVIYQETGIDVDDYYHNWQEKYGKLKVEPTRICGIVIHEHNEMPDEQAD